MIDPLGSGQKETELNNRVYSFQRSEFHPCIWIGTEGPGLCYYSYKENRMKTIPQQEDTPPIRYIHSICEVNDSTLWLATTGNGLLKVTLRMDKVTPTISKIQTFPLKNGENTCKEIQSMIYDNDSTLFLGSRGGYGVISFNIFNQKYEFLQTNNLRNPAIGDVYARPRILLSMQAPAPDLPGLNLKEERYIYANSIKATGSQTT